jgi:hypothetical protein
MDKVKAAFATAVTFATEHKKLTLVVGCVVAGVIIAKLI